jgi:GNAT superfamily N-acetyltransferase
MTHEGLTTFEVSKDKRLVRLVVDPDSDPVLLTKTHEIAGFDCGKPPLNDFLLKYALQNQAGGGARSYVLTRGNRVIGYYSLAPASIAPEDAPARVIKGQGRYPVPVILMARFAVDQGEQGKGYGKALFRDAMRRALSGAEAIGGRAFLVHAKDDEASAFYMKFGMEESPTNPMHLLLLFKDIRQSLAAAS